MTLKRVNDENSTSNLSNCAARGWKDGLILHPFAARIRRERPQMQTAVYNQGFAGHY